MALNIVLLLVGIALLYLGSEWMVKGAASLALSLSVRPVIVGLTVVAFATSAPELLVSLIAAVRGSSGVSLGNILGSNVANLGLVLGASAVVKPLVVGRSMVLREIPYMIVASGAFWFICADGFIGRVDGIVLLAGLGVFLLLGIKTARKKETVALEVGVPGRRRILWYLFLVTMGMGGLVVGAHLIVTSAIFIATRLGLSEVFIGLSIVAVGTSLPELATSVVASARGEHEISVGNVVGSNVFNVCLVIGTVGLFNPMSVDMRLMHFEFPAMFFLCLTLWIFGRTGFRLNRLEGLFFVVSFVLFVGLSYGLG
jgi:cation:H+ antiporter